MALRRSEKDKELADREKLTRMWRRWHVEQLEEALAGVHADVMKRLMAELKELQSARALVDFIAGQDWTVVDADTRAIALQEINAAITKVRELANPKEPISDPLPGEPPNAFQAIREIVTKVSPPPREKSQLRGRAWVDRRTCHECRREDSERAD
jgi:hypothetical protein